MTAVPAFDDCPAAQVSPVARLVALVFHRLLDRIDRGLATGAIEATLPDGTARLLGGRVEAAWLSGDRLAGRISTG